MESINAMLRPEQRPLYDAFRAERERQRKLHDAAEEVMTTECARDRQRTEGPSYSKKAGPGLPF